MDEKDVEALARSLGLDRALALFRGEVIAAMQQVAQQRAALRRPLPQDVEPWPPMRVPDA